MSGSRNYDKALINSHIVEVCGYYLPGEGRREGQKRRIWECPVCGSDSFSANSQRGYAGCFSSCEMPRAVDALAIIARFEDLELSGSGFVRCLQKGYEILGISEPADESAVHDGRRRPESTPGPSTQDDVPEEPATETIGTTAVVDEPGPVRDAQEAQEAQAPTGDYERVAEEADQAGFAQTRASAPALDPGQQRELVHGVYRAMMDLCPLTERHEEFWLSRGVYEKTMAEAGLSSMWRERCREVLAELEQRFGRDSLISVPGFYVSESGRLQTNLYDDYTLIPYHDREGYITTVEGRVPGVPEDGKPKYMAPVNSGLHLYIFPGHEPERIMAFVEGAVGAIVAAQAGIPVAAIKGYQHYRVFECGSYRPLPEHATTDFGGRKVLYIPDEDVKPKTYESVQAEAPKAARCLIEEHGGKPLIARLPEGYKDLDEWLLSVPEPERVPAFATLMPTGLTPGQWEGSEPIARSSDEEQNSGTEDEGQAAASARGPGTVHQSKERRDDDTSSHEASASQDAESEDDQTSTGSSGSGQDDPHQPGTRVNTRAPQPRAYRPIKKTNIGELMVALLYGLLAGAGFLTLMLYAAPEWQVISVLTGLPPLLVLVLSFALAVVVTTFVCRRLYVRRWRALRAHLAGGR